MFTIGVFMGEKMLGEGSGKSKQQGEENAAKVALEAQGK